MTQRQLFMEEALPMPLYDVLPIIQEKVTRGTYFGIPTMKSPLDLWVYQEIITEIKPDVIIEIGTYKGGSALALAHLLDGIDKGEVISIDKDPAPDFSHPRISWVTSDANNFYPKKIEAGKKVLVIEDSSHEYNNTLNLLRGYCDLVSVGSYFIVEDTICRHGLDVGPLPGPYEAVQTFLSENKNFEADRGREPYLITWNPMGYLKRME